MKWFHQGVTFNIREQATACPSCGTMVHTLSEPEQDIGAMCPSCHPNWEHAPFIGQRPEDLSLAQWKQKIKERKAKLMAERIQAAQEARDSQ
jgi:endogenous inhibitor of DNA gyrase (YacG/DUF329 family)